MELEPGVREALDDVLARGEKDGKEHFILVRDGQRVFEKDGDENMVDVEDKRDLFKPGDIAVHNHPNLLSLSDGDLMMARSAKAKAVYAITPDGSIYKGSINPKTSFFGFAWGFEEGLLRYTAVPAIVHIALSIPNFHERMSDARHWAWKDMAAKGLIQYEYELGPETTNLVTEFEERLNVWRQEAP